MIDVSLEFISRQIERVLSEQADIRDQLADIRSELRVMNARLSHVETAIDSLRRQFERMNDRMRILENR